MPLPRLPLPPMPLPLGAMEVPKLTRREMSVLELVGDGKLNKEIAAQLGVGLRYVEKVVRQLLEKTNSPNRTALVRRALQVSMPCLPLLASARLCSPLLASACLCLPLLASDCLPTLCECLLSARAPRRMLTQIRMLTPIRILTGPSCGVSTARRSQMGLLFDEPLPSRPVIQMGGRNFPQIPPAEEVAHQGQQGQQGQQA